MSNKPGIVMPVADCFKCGGLIEPGVSYYSLGSGVSDGLTVMLDDSASPMHMYCFDPYDVYFSLVPHQSVVITLHL
jgi:hypothetical protein